MPPEPFPEPVWSTLNTTAVELTKTFARNNQAVCFQFRIGSSSACSQMVEIPLLDAGFSEARLMLGVRRGRVLPVAAAAFAEQLESELDRF